MNNPRLYIYSQMEALLSVSIFIYINKITFMRKIRLNENKLKTIIDFTIKESVPNSQILTDDDEDNDEYVDDTYYSIWNYKNEIEAYLNQVASIDNGYVEMEDEQFYIDFNDFQVFFNLDNKVGILYIEKIEMYSRLDYNQAKKNDVVLLNVIKFVNEHPLNVSQEKI